MPTKGLEYWMWNAKKDMIDPYKLAINVFGPESAWIRDQCINFHFFQLFLAAFLSIILLYLSVCISTINHIKC